MAILSYQGMIDGASKTFTDPTSLFKNPASDGLAKLTSTSGGMALIEECFAPPPAIPGDPFVSAIGSGASALSSQVTNHLTSKVASLHQELSLMGAAESNAVNVATIDAIAAGNLTSGPDPIAIAFSGSSCPPSINPKTADAFKTVTDSTSLLTNIHTSTTSALDALPDLPTLLSAVGAVVGSTISNADQLLTVLGSAVGPVRSLVISAIQSTASSLPSLLSGLTTAVANVQTSISGAASDFSSWISGETAAISSAITQLQSTYTVSLLNSKDPCVQKIMNAAVNPSVVNQRALIAVDESNIVENPKQAAVDLARSGAPVANIESTVKKEPVVPPPPDGDPEAYTIEQLEVMKADWEAESDTVDSLKAANATWWHDNFIQWKKSVNYDAVAAAAGWILSEQRYVDPNPATPAQIAAYQSLRAQGLEKRDYYNNTLLVQSNNAVKLYEAKRLEWSRRFKYGKHPYTTMMAAGATFTDAEQTTYYDTTK